MSFMCSSITDRVSCMTGDAIELGSVLGLAVAGSDVRSAGWAAGVAAGNSKLGRVTGTAEVEACRWTVGFVVFDSSAV